MLVHLVFLPPGFFAVDFPVTVAVDGVEHYRGSFVRGFSLELTLEPGRHEVTTRIGTGFLSKERKLELVVDPLVSDPLVATLTYSRMWGNFDETLDVRSGEATFFANGQDHAMEAPGARGLDLPTHKVRVTFAIAAVLALVTGLEYVLPVRPREGLSPSLDTLDAFGALGPTALHDGEWHRLVMATLLHLDPVHLALNVFCLVMVGVVLEPKIGGRALAAIYAISAIGGSFGSLLLNPGNVLSVGASGAILGLFGAGMVLVEAYPAFERGRLRLQLGRVLVPSLLPFLDRHGQGVDFGAHIGGALVGAAAGALLLVRLKKGRSPERVSLGIASAFVVLGFVSSAIVIARTYPQEKAKAALLAELVPDEELPEKGVPSNDKYEKWSTKFPNDPRVLLWQAERALDRRDEPAFEDSCTRAESAIARTGEVFPPETRKAFSDDLARLRDDRNLLLLLPNDVLPKGNGGEAEKAWRAHLADWLVRFPNDPRVRFEAAAEAFEDKDYEKALRESAACRASVPAIAKFFQKPLDFGTLAPIEILSLRHLGRNEEAEARLRSACSGEDGEDARRAVEQHKVCKVP
jgi:rhomboid protease GluP